MSEEVYEPTGELNNLLADRAGRAQDAKIEQGATHQPGPPLEASDLPAEIDGVPVELYEEPAVKHRGFTRAQIERMDHETYERLKPEILFAKDHGLLIDDKSDPAWIAEQKRQRDAVASAFSESNERITLPIMVREAAKAADQAHDDWKSAQAEHQAAYAATGISSDPRVRLAALDVVREKQAAWEEASAKLKELEARNLDMRLGRKPKAVEA